MNNLSIYDELDQAIEAMIADTGVPSSVEEPEVLELTEMAAVLRQLPRPDFKARLKTELEWVASARPLSSDRPPQTGHGTQVVPSLFGNLYGSYPIRHANFAASLALHAAAMVFILASTFWMAHPKPAVKHTIEVMPLTISQDEIAGAIAPHGGGGGGDTSKLNAPKGDLPLPAERQITTPVVVNMNQHPLLPVESTIIAPNLRVPQPEHIGDPLSSLMIPSNGPGVRSGVGSGSAGGIGAGNGAGTGLGSGGGYGGGIFTVGNGVTAPRVIYDPEPEYSVEARAAKYQGTVKLWAVIGANGLTRDVHVAQSLGMGLDEKAVAAVRQWRFEPARKGGQAVAVQIEVEVSFHLY